MNIFEEIKQNNKNNLEKTAMIMRFENGTQRSYNYEQTFEAVNLYAELLHKAQICAGDRIAIVAESCPEWSIAYLAIASLKATSVLLDASLTQQELLELLEKSDVRCIFASEKAIEKLGDIDLVTFNLSLNPDVYLKQSQPKLPVSKIIGNETVASVIFSSGTTKKASGIMHSHDSLFNSALMCMNTNHLEYADLFMAILPNSHIYGLMSQLIGPFMVGATVCFIEEMNSQALVSAFQNFRPTVFPAVPKIYELLKTQIMQKINSEKSTRKLFKTVFPICLSLRKKIKMNLGKILFKKVHDNFGGQLRVLCSAGAPTNVETADFFYGLGFDFLVTYGATETCIPTIGNYTNRVTTDTCGRPYPNIKIKFNENGEILIKTPYQMLGYFQDEIATNQAFDEDGWFYSGDLGCMDKKGLVHILGRCKDNIVLANGKKIAPDDIENAYANISYVKELVACGIPVADGSYDEVHAFFIAEQDKDGLALEQIKARSNILSQNQKLIGIHAVTEIPKTALQKPKRFLLKQMLSKGQISECTSQEEPKSNDATTCVMNAIARVSGTTDFCLTTKLFEELTIDSLSSLDLACEIDEKCNVRVEHLLHKNMTVSQLIDCVVSPIAQEQLTTESSYPIHKSRFSYQFFCFFRNLLRGLYRVKVKNDTVLPENSGYIICANHVSNFDYLYLTLNFTKERFLKFCCMAKKELFQNNWISKVLTNICGMIPVDRCGIVADTMSAIQSQLKEKWGVLIHPEGTRSKTGKLGKFKNGAAVLAIDADVPIVPAYIKGGFEVFPCSKKLPQLFNWKHMCKYQIDVIYGEPIFPGGRSPEELMNAIKSAMTVLANNEIILPAN